MTNDLEKFFIELRGIQDFIVDEYALRKEQYNNLEDILTDVSYELLYRFMELIDGYQNQNVKYEIKNIYTDKIINEDIDLHNFCEEYLGHTDI